MGSCGKRAIQPLRGSRLVTPCMKCAQPVIQLLRCSALISTCSDCRRGQKERHETILTSFIDDGAKISRPECVAHHMVVLGRVQHVGSLRWSSRVFIQTRSSLHSSSIVARMTVFTQCFPLEV